jgi:hypothetical protein
LRHGRTLCKVVAHRGFALGLVREAFLQEFAGVAQSDLRLLALMAGWAVGAWFGLATVGPLNPRD